MVTAGNAELTRAMPQRIQWRSWAGALGMECILVEWLVGSRELGYTSAGERVFWESAPCTGGDSEPVLGGPVGSRALPTSRLSGRGCARQCPVQCYWECAGCDGMATARATSDS